MSVFKQNNRFTDIKSSDQSVLLRGWRRERHPDITTWYVKSGTRWVRYLYLTVVTDGFDGCGRSQGGFCTSGVKLHNRFGPAHQACHCATVFNQLLLLLLWRKIIFVIQISVMCQSLIVAAAFAPVSENSVYVSQSSIIHAVNEHGSDFQLRCK